MTPAEHEKESDRIKLIIANSQKLLKLPLNLKQKLEVKNSIKYLEEVLRVHRLNYYVFTGQKQPAED